MSTCKLYAPNTHVHAPAELANDAAELVNLLREVGVLEHEVVVAEVRDVLKLGDDAQVLQPDVHADARVLTKPVEVSLLSTGALARDAPSSSVAVSNYMYFTYIRYEAYAL